jgi:DnaJ homolog subfamily C member 28
MPDQRRPEGDEEEEFSPRRQGLSQRTYHSAIDQQIAAAQEKGAFTNLPGQGKPLERDDDIFVPDELRVGYKMLKSAGFAPPWIEQQKEITEERAKLAKWLDSANARWRHAAPAERARLEGIYREKLVHLNRIILNYNLSVPQTVGQIPGIRIEDEFAKLGR